MNQERDKGRELEWQIARFLGQHGYTVSTNVRLPGRSGAIHELDVVGDKSDGLTSFRLVVECKAWDTPISKEVVYKLAAELADLGAARGVIATLSGWTVQAAQTAVQANIELWGPEELRTRVGSAVMQTLRSGWQSVASLGFACAVSADTARRAIDKSARGHLGFRGDEVTWFGLLWLPVWWLQLAITRLEGVFSQVPRVTHVWSGYEGLTGSYFLTATTTPSLVNVDVSAGHLAPLVQGSAVEASIRKAFGQWAKVTTQAAKQRHATALAQMGLQLPIAAISVEEATLIHMPLWIAFLRKGGRERIVAVFATTGRESPLAGRVLSTHIHLVREALASR